ncbi:hypothetical protein PMAYCL1PPCAC_01613, partial [Pristionchus mayeri]
EPDVIGRLLEGSPFRLGRFCDSGNDCFVIQQRYWRRDRGIAAHRLIMYELNDNMAMTMANLIVPEIVTAHHLAHERWRVDHSRPVFTYNLMQIAAGFMLGGLSFGHNSSSPLQLQQSQRVLQIGMGGGTATGFLATMPVDLRIDVVELEPTVFDAAKRWFEFPQSPNV